MSRFLLLLLIGVATVAAQDTPYTLKVDVSVVTVDVAVFNESGRPVTGLGKNDFAIYEDGRPQQIQTFAPVDAPYNMLLVVDRSGSMASTFPLLLAAVNRFLSNLRTQDQFALGAFDRSVKRLVAWRGARTGSNRTVKLGPGGDTDFYRALEWAADELGKVRGRKAALFYTDGIDHRVNEPEVEAKASRRAMQYIRRANAPFHFVGLGVNPAYGGDNLKRIAEETGGQIHFPEKVDELVPLYDRISRDLSISYTLGYLSDKPARDKTNRRIQVAVPGTTYRLTQSRSGYTAN